MNPDARQSLRVTRRGFLLRAAPSALSALSGGLLATAAQTSAGAQRALESGRVPTPLRVPFPELLGDGWLNTPSGGPLRLETRWGKVTLVHFWTFG